MEEQRDERQEMVPCPLCEGQKRRGYLVCTNCNQGYVKEAANAVFNGQPALLKEDWGEEKIRVRLPDLREAVAKAREEYRRCQELQSKRIDEILLEKTKSQKLSLEVLTEVRKRLLEEQGREIWRTVGGAKAIWQLRTAESRLKEAVRLLRDLVAKRTATAEAPPSSEETPLVETAPEPANNKKGSRSRAGEEDAPPSRHQPKPKGGRNGEKVALLQEVNTI